MIRCLTALALMAAFAAPALAAQPFRVGERWDWQLTEPLDLSRKVAVLDLHPELVKTADIGKLKARGIRTICYVSVGTVEKTSPDSQAFPKAVIGKVYGDWPDERFLDIRRHDVLLPIMKARFQACKAKGFDAIEPDNMDVHDNDSGFPLKAADTRRYVLALAGIAHGLGLAIAQKNVPEMTADFVSTLDFVITESCYQDRWCDRVKAYPQRGKPVFDAEYSDRSIDFAAACKAAGRDRISMILKDRHLTRAVKFCPAN